MFDRPAAPLLATAALAIASWVAPPLAGADAPAASPLDWMAGSWRGETGGTVHEEHWTTGAGGEHVGMHKEVRDGRVVSFEFLRIVPGEDGKPCYVASPGGAAPTTFCAVEVGERRVVFENLRHDFPQRILYRLTDEGALAARVEGPREGGVAALEWTWIRSGP